MKTQELVDAIRPVVEDLGAPLIYVDKASFDRLVLVLEKAIEQRDQRKGSNNHMIPTHVVNERDNKELLKIAGES